MSSDHTDAFIVYCSPAGTTRHVARTIETALSSEGKSVVSCDLGKQRDFSPVIERIRAAREPYCLYIGTPVYACHAVPPVMRFIENLPAAAGPCYAVPFATWGAVTSGMALYEMAKPLCGKGYRILGAAKVLAVHSLLWQVPSPLGKGHPDADDDRKITGLVTDVAEKIAGGDPRSLELSALAYQPQEAYEGMKKVTLAVAGQMLPQRRVDTQSCTQCGICERECPAAAITCDPFPSFGPDCILCYTCMQVCPEKAIQAHMTDMEQWLLTKSKESGEQPETHIFI